MFLLFDNHQLNAHFQLVKQLDYNQLQKLYFMIYRPQAKRAKTHRDLMSSLAKGDEVLTSGGLVGKIAKVSADSDYIVLALNDQTQVTIKRDFVSAVLPKGSIQSL